MTSLLTVAYEHWNRKLKDLLCKQTFTTNYEHFASSFETIIQLTGNEERSSIYFMYHFNLLLWITRFKSFNINTYRIINCIHIFIVLSIVSYIYYNSKICQPEDMIKMILKMFRSGKGNKVGGAPPTHTQVCS